LVQPVPEGTIVLGHELHQSLQLEPGQRTRLLGREFSVHRCHEQRGSQDDITAWIHLAEAQELFDMEGRLHAILALECLCAGMPGVEKFRAEVGRVLPGTEVLEFGTQALTRAEARFALGKEARAELAREEQARADMRKARESFAAVLLPTILLLSGVGLAALAAANARSRCGEFALLRALGLRGSGILALVLGRYALLALPGGLAGWLAGATGGLWLAAWLDPIALAAPAPVLAWREGIGLLAMAVLAAVAAAWLPALIAVRRDPAAVLKEE
jgi:ABC-type lipoprotein release transport system permease subunit